MNWLDLDASSQGLKQRVFNRVLTVSFIFLHAHKGTSGDLGEIYCFLGHTLIEVFGDYFLVRQEQRL